MDQTEALKMNQQYQIDLPDDDIRAGKFCPYCGHPPELTESYFGKRWECSGCEAYVGCHPNTEIPLGSLANAQLREKRRELHEYFDQMWRFAKHKRKIPKHEARGAAYRWLAEQMGMDPKECHIGMMDMEECALAIRLCKPYYKPNLYF